MARTKQTKAVRRAGHYQIVVEIEEKKADYFSDSSDSSTVEYFSDVPPTPVHTTINYNSDDIPPVSPAYAAVNYAPSSPGHSTNYYSDEENVEFVKETKLSQEILNRFGTLNKPIVL
jgi:hypothetical protein